AAADYDRALEELKDAGDEPAKAVRGQARILKVLKDRDLVKQPLDKAATDEVNVGLKELREGKNEALANQIERGLREPETLAKSTKALEETKQALANERGKLDTLAKDYSKKLDDANKMLIARAKDLDDT